jgi:hypothetical protein
MHFLMPHVFRSQAEFKHWFANPLNAIVEQGGENGQAVRRLHAVMRPFILRRLKRDVAKQLPEKVEHVVKIQVRSACVCAGGGIVRALTKASAARTPPTLPVRGLYLARVHAGDAGGRRVPGHDVHPDEAAHGVQPP